MIYYCISYSGNLFKILNVIKYGSLNHSIYANYDNVGLVYIDGVSIKLKNDKNDSGNISLNLIKSKVFKNFK